MAGRGRSHPSSPLPDCLENKKSSIALQVHYSKMAVFETRLSRGIIKAEESTGSSVPSHATQKQWQGGKSQQSENGQPLHFLNSRVSKSKVDKAKGFSKQIQLRCQPLGSKRALPRP